MPSLSQDSKEKLLNEIGTLFDKAVRDSSNGAGFRQRGDDLARLRQLVLEKNRLDSDNSESSGLRTREQFFKDVAAGRLR
jgi:hypothetical protein